ncbi:MAG: LLM class flavin-dependent oxidoreductase [Chloroflexi bacterium]|nr:LLM class flavin-dependent oxidoreductase [Chloroflexota bacterium]
MVKYGYALGDNMDPSALIERARMIESAGFDVAWSNELFTSPFVPLATVAPHVPKIHLGSSIAYGFTRSPLETAITALDLDAITEGRFILGLGSGVRRLNESWHGVPDYGRPAPHLKECVQAVRRIIEAIGKGEPVRFEGKYYDIDMRGWGGSRQPVRGHIPIFMAAVREGMTRAAGDVADGILGFPMWSLKWIKEVILPNVAIGLKRSGRDRKEIEVWASVTVAITGDKKQGYLDARGVPGFYTTVRTYQPLVAWHGYEKEAGQIRDAFVKLQGFGPEVLEPVHQEMVDTFVIVGTADEARKRVAEFAEVCDAIDFNVPSYFVPKERVAEYEKALFETFGR